MKNIGKLLALGAVLVVCAAYYLSVGAMDVAPPTFPAITWGVSERQGNRPSMEDAYYANDEAGVKIYGIFDGHGGRSTADYVAANLATKYHAASGDAGARLKMSFEDLHQHVVANFRDGATAIVAAIEGSHLTLAWLGDARAVLERNGMLADATQDHEFTEAEIRAIWARGGRVRIMIGGDMGRLRENRSFVGNDFRHLENFHKYGKRPDEHGMHHTLRVEDNQGRPSLNMPRSLGDAHVARFMSHEPGLKSIQLEPGNNFLILACDGVWDVLDNEEAIGIVRQAFDSKSALSARNLFEPTTEHGDDACVMAARALIDAAYEKGSGDNISALVIAFDWKKKEAEVDEAIKKITTLEGSVEKEEQEKILRAHLEAGRGFEKVLEEAMKLKEDEAMTKKLEALHLFSLLVEQGRAYEQAGEAADAVLGVAKAMWQKAPAMRLKKLIEKKKAEAEK